MFDIRILKKYDKEGMYTVYDRWPQTAAEYSEKNYDHVDFKGISHVVYVGMGGSGAIGDAISAVMSNTKMHTCVVKGYHLPITTDSSTLVIATSASGNTLETLTVMTSAKKTGAKIIAFSSGGKMESYCKNNQIEFRKIPIINSPRASYPQYLYSILNVLEQTIHVNKNHVKQSIKELEKTQKKISLTNLTNNPSIELAKWISDIPIIYYPAGLQAAAIRFKNSLQENVKLHAIAEDVIEASHNGIVSWERPSIVKPIMIQGKDDYIKTKELWKIIKEYFAMNKIEYREVHSISGNILSKIVNLVYLLDYTTIYRAVMSKVDPTPVKSIDFIKNKFNTYLM